MFEQSKRAFKKFLQGVRDGAADIKADMDQIREGESETIKALKGHYDLTPEHLSVTLALPLRSAVLTGNIPFLCGLNQVDERQQERIQQLLAKDFDIHSEDDLYHRINTFYVHGDGIFGIVTSLHLALLGVDAGYIEFKDIEESCIASLEPIIFDESITSWADYMDQIADNKSQSWLNHGMAFKAMKKILMNDPNTPWQLVTFEDVRQTYIANHADLEGRERVHAFMSSLKVPTFDQIALSLVAPWRVGTTSGYITRLVAYGELSQTHREQFAALMDETFGIRDAISLEQALDVLESQYTIPFFALTGLFFITSAIELEMVNPDLYREKMITYMDVVLTQSDFTEWANLADSLMETNNEYLVKDPDYLHGELVELFSNGLSPWNTFTFELVKNTFALYR